MKAPVGRPSGRGGVTSTEFIIIICCVAVACLIMVTAFGRQIALLFRRDTVALEKGKVLKTATPDITDLTKEFKPEWADANQPDPKKKGPPDRSPQLGDPVGSQADLYSNPATDPSSKKGLDDFFGAGKDPDTVKKKDFPASVTVPKEVLDTTSDLQRQQLDTNARSGPGQPFDPNKIREHGGIIVRRADGTLYIRPGNNPGAQSGWNPNYTDVPAGEELVGTFHMHSPHGRPNKSPEGFSGADFNTDPKERIVMMRTGDTIYMAVRNQDTDTTVTSDQLNQVGDRAYDDAIEAGATPAEARFAANRAMAQRAGWTLYRGRVGDPLQRVE